MLLFACLPFRYVTLPRCLFHAFRAIRYAMPRFTATCRYSRHAVCRVFVFAITLKMLRHMRACARVTLARYRASHAVVIELLRYAYVERVVAHADECAARAARAR